MNAQRAAPKPVSYCTRPSRRAVRAAVCAVVCAAAASASRAEPPAPAPSPAAATSPAAIAGPPAYHDTASGVDIFTTLEPDLFPPSWHEPAIAATAGALAPAESSRAVRIIKVALSKYPAGLLKLNLERVYVVGDLKFQGISAAGTNSASRLFLKIDADNPLYTDSFIEESFHHEFAHLLRRNYAFLWDDAVWNKCNPADFHYAAPSGVEAVREGRASLHFSDDWSRRGFLSEYAASDLGEDFATVGGSLFNGDPEFWPRIDRFPALKAKVQAAIAFYGQLDPLFDEVYFRALRAGAAYVPPPEAPEPPAPSDSTSPTVVAAPPAAASPAPTPAP